MVLENCMPALVRVHKRSINNIVMRGEVTVRNEVVFILAD